MNFEWSILGMCVIPTVSYFLLAAKMSPYFVDRYIMAIFPMTALIILLLWDRVGMNLASGVIVFLIVVSQGFSLQGGHTYLYRGYEAQLQVAKEHAEYPLVCFYDGYGFYENVMEMEQYEQTILVKRGELQFMDETRTNVTSQGYVALIKYPGDESGKAQLNEVMQVFGEGSAELLYEGGAFNDVIYLVTP